MDRHLRGCSYLYQMIRKSGEISSLWSVVALIIQNVLRVQAIGRQQRCCTSKHLMPCECWSCFESGIYSLTTQTVKACQGRSASPRNFRILNTITTNEYPRTTLFSFIFVTCFCNWSFHPPCIHSLALLWEAVTAHDQRLANSDSRSSRSIAFSNHNSSNHNRLRSHHNQRAMEQTLFSRNSLATQVQDCKRAFKRLRRSRSLLAISLQANHPNSRASNSRHNHNLSNPLRHSRYSSRNSHPLLLYVLSRPPLRLCNRFRGRHPRQLHQSRAASNQGGSQT
jgi:hypothetical protein